MLFLGKMWLFNNTVGPRYSLVVVDRVIGEPRSETDHRRVDETSESMYSPRFAPSLKIT